MANYAIRKTLLAAAIAATAQTAIAAPTEVTVAGSIGQEITGSHEAINLSGTATRAADEDGVEFAGVQVSGGVTNNANITTSGLAVDGMDFDMADDGLGAASDIGGDITNNGNLNITGAGAVGIVLDNTATNSLINNGVITVKGQYDAVEQDTVRGIEIGNSQLNGDLVNAGTISVDYAGAEGIGIYTADGTSGDDYTSIDMDIINSGAINVSGLNSRGIHLKGLEFGQDIENEGSISVNGDSSIAVRVESTGYNAIVNEGTITATGADASGIVVYNSISPVQKNQNNGIVNRGTIVADGTAINVLNEEVNFEEAHLYYGPNTLPEIILESYPGAGAETLYGQHSFVVNQHAGLIEGKDVSISGNFQTTVNMYGGTIRGDMEAISEVNVYGNSTIDAGLIETVVVDIHSGDLYLARLNTDIDGNLKVHSAAALKVRLSDSTDPNSPIVKVADAEFQNGSKIKLTAQVGDFKQVEGTQYTVLSADSLKNDGLTVESASALIKVRSFKVENGVISAVVGGVDGNAAGGILTAAGASANAVAAAKPFTDSVLPNLDENDPLYQQFVNADNAELAKLAEQLVPEVNGGAHSAALSASDLASNSASARVGAVGANSGDVLMETGAWVKVLSSNADQNTRNSVPGYDADSNGILIGADGKLNEQTTLGVAYSFVNTDVDSENGNKTEVDSHILTAYAGWENGPISVDGSISYGKSQNDSERFIAGTVAKGDYDSDMLAANVTAGYAFGLSESLTIEPLVAARYSNVKIDAFAEKGSSAALSTGSQRLEVAELGFGVRAAGSYTLGNGTFEPEARLMAFHDFAADSASTTSTYVLGGNPFVSNGAEPTKKTYEAGLGLSYVMGNITVGAGYDYIRKADYNADVFNLNARYDF